MGILPLQFRAGESVDTLGLTGTEIYDVLGLPEAVRTGFAAGRMLLVRVTNGGAAREIPVVVRIDTPQELAYYKHGGILPYVLRQLLSGRVERGQGGSSKR